MELLEAIYTRRSIRQYQDRPVSDEVVRTILGAAMMAPSAGNVQPWQFIVVTDPALLNQVKDVHPYVGMAAEAPLGILVCGDLSLEKYPGFGCRTVRPPCRICCWRLTTRGLVRFGPVFTRSANVLNVSAAYLICPNRSSRWDLPSSAGPSNRDGARSATRRPGSTKIAGRAEARSRKHGALRPARSCLLS